VTKRFLERRLHFKELRRYPEGSPEYDFCEQRQGALKSILVCLYGTLGCYWNDFGNVLCFEEINSHSREAMIIAKDCAQEIGRRTGFPISLDHYYKFLVLLPLEADPSDNMDAQRHYFWVLTDGELAHMPGRLRMSRRP